MPEKKRKISYSRSEKFSNVAKLFWLYFCALKTKSTSQARIKLEIFVNFRPNPARTRPELSPNPNPARLTTLVCHLPWGLTTKRCALLHKNKNVSNRVTMIWWGRHFFVLPLCILFTCNCTVYSKCGFFFVCMYWYMNKLTLTDWLSIVTYLICL